MLKALCGSDNIQKILLFLFVNNSCYGAQLQRALKIPLTPVQKALLRLEKGGIIASRYEGKTRLYSFNPAFPLLSELQQLLKKTYTLLSPQEKKSYSFIKRQAKTEPENRQILMSFWKRLETIKRLVFQAKTKAHEETGWHGKGKGEVLVSKEGETVLIFQEKGSWQGNHGAELAFSNTFRWTLDSRSGLISLEHLRQGASRPVFLFHLIPSGRDALSSHDAHLCEEDTYFGQLLFDAYALRLSWRVIGPKKNEDIEYYYT